MHTRASPHDDGHSFNYSQLFKNFSKANIIGPFDKIGIVFQPLGINHFMSDNSSKFINDEINVNFNYFQKTLSPVLEKVFAENSLEAKIDLLDGYFLNHLSEVEDKRISNAITIIFQSDEKLSAQDLSDSLNINRKTLLRLFNRHLNCSPKDYIILIQFRKAVELYQNASHKPSLTRLALDLDYYDQSDFIHRFTKITGVNPTKLFNNLKEFGVHSTYWSTN
ncbi:MAG: AraC-like DNA-binding protein [Salibacteraceae bacterium]|jgi:AraC-like DNA-binding protein